MAVIDENHDKEEKNDNDNDDEFADDHVTHAAKPATPGFAHLRRGSAPIILHQVSLT